MPSLDPAAAKSRVVVGLPIAGEPFAARNGGKGNVCYIYVDELYVINDVF